MKQENKQPLSMAFATQKGGVGKTTFTVLTASYLHYTKGYNVLVVDCDYPQHSIHWLRQREVETVSSNKGLKSLAFEQFTELNKKAYTILKTSTQSAPTLVAEHLRQSDKLPDIVLFDIPGTVNTTGMHRLLMLLDVFVVPISADRVILESSLNFAKAISEMIKGETGKQLYLFWNMEDKREKTSLYESYTKGIQSLGLNILATRIPDTKRYRKEVLSEHQRPFRSTLFPPDKQIAKGSNITELIDEIINTLKQ